VSAGNGNGASAGERGGGGNGATPGERGRSVNGGGAATVGPRAERVAIVGGGASGTVAAAHLLREPREHALEVWLIDRDGQIGRGVAYGTTDPLHLLNVPAVRMGAVSGHPEHFHEWLLATGHDEPEEAFMTRGLYGDYLLALLADAEASCTDAVLHRRHGEVVAIAAGAAADLPAAPGAGARLTFADGDALDVDRVILALGPLSGGDPIPVPEEIKREGLWIGDPWAPGALDEARDLESVLIVGTGLTMVDVCLTLSKGERGPRIKAVSRHGLVPRRHRRDLTRLRRFPVPLEDGSLDQVVAAVIEQMCRVAQQGDDWRDVIDSMRPATPTIWKALRLEDKRRFLTELQRIWDVHRFRMAPDVADRLEELTAAGRVSFDADSIAALEPQCGGRVRVSLRTPGQHELETIEVDRVINCTGAGCDLRRQAPLLLRSLLEAGTARADELGLGLDVDDDGAILDHAGRPSDRVFVVGALRKGVEWEAIGLTEIRDHSAAVASRLVAAAERPRAASVTASASPGVSPALAAEITPGAHRPEGYRRPPVGRAGGVMVGLDLIESRESGAAVAAALADLAAGRMVLLCDDRDRGGEGDLLLAAEFATADAVNFMAKEARGVVCLALAPERADELGLDPISPSGRSALGDASLVSIEAKDGVTTGISAADRARTIRVAVDPEAGAEDLVRPGHVFPLRAQAGGVLERPGRIESAVELAAAADLVPAGVLCQVLRDDGRTASGADLERFAARHGLNLVTVSAVVEQRLAAEDASQRGRPFPPIAPERTTAGRGDGDGDAPRAVPDPGRQMRDVMGHFATGVSVISARDGDGAPVGTTANAISSVSLEPPLLLACLAEGSETLAAIRESGRFAVNVLAAHQREHSDRFAARGEAAKPHEVGFEDHPLGVPVLPGALATIACEVEAIHRAGDHDIVVGHARALAQSDAAAEPLLFYRGSYSQLTIEEDDLAA
jgi:3,4-dihydroxy-2-butanone 4-phosphate synthase